MERIAKFDEILDAEQVNRTDYVLASMGSDLDTRARAQERLPQSKARQFALLDALTAEELGAFVEYRRAHRVEQGLPVAR